jgi:hypothetical protein
MHHWMVNVSRPFGLTSPMTWRELWYTEVPLLGLQHENVLYALFAMAATHLLTTLETREEVLVQARLKYWVWALREQTASVANLGTANKDAVAFAALLITMNALIMLQERSLEPYEPPIEWLEVGRGAFAVLPDIEKVDEHRGLKISQQYFRKKYLRLMTGLISTLLRRTRLRLAILAPSAKLQWLLGRQLTSS